MSYKNDMERFREEQNARRRTLTLIIKITVLALAVAILVTGVAAGITLLLNNDKPRGDDGDGGGSSSGGFRITGPKGNTVTLMIGDKPLYKSYVTVSDPNAQLEVNSEADTSKAGTYKVRYTATNAAGKKATYTLTLIVSADPTYTRERLMGMIAVKAEDLGISESMSKAEMVRRIYDYVKDPSANSPDAARIYFSDESNTPSQSAQSGIRTGWETDWVEEAIRTLSMGRMKGDCYTYYSVSKAFFEYFGIENIGIQRSANSNHSGTHFWHAVNVGTKEAPRWYYYDATRLAGSFSDGTKDSCLITEEKLMSYKTSKGESGFYTFDKSQYKNFPKMETTPLS